MRGTRPVDQRPDTETKRASRHVDFSLPIVGVVSSGEGHMLSPKRAERSSTPAWKDFLCHNPASDDTRQLHSETQLKNRSISVCRNPWDSLLHMKGFCHAAGASLIAGSGPAAIA
jgi:hypothetical protein